MPSANYCHHCGSEVGPVERIGRRDACLRCRADLHCCLNCRFYELYAHNQCREPQAERQVDKTVGNVCEFFSFREGQPAQAPKTDAARARLEALFSKKK